MSKKSVQSDPFDVEYVITFSGRTRGDGVYTVTAQMVRDKLLAVLEKMLEDGYIRDFSVSAARNKIEEAMETIEKSKKNGNHK